MVEGSNALKCENCLKALQGHPLLFHRCIYHLYLDGHFPAILNHNIMFITFTIIAITIIITIAIVSHSIMTITIIIITIVPL